MVLPHDPLSDVPLVHQSHAIYALVAVAETGTVIHPEYAVTVLAVCAIGSVCTDRADKRLQPLHLGSGIAVLDCQFIGRFAICARCAVLAGAAVLACVADQLYQPLLHSAGITVLDCQIISRFSDLSFFAGFADEGCQPLFNSSFIAVLYSNLVR